MSKYLILLLALACWALTGKAQIFCPPNIDFEQGGFNNWNCYTGVNNVLGNFNWANNGPVLNRHVLTTGNGFDPYGGFPIT